MSELDPTTPEPIAEFEPLSEVAPQTPQPPSLRRLFFGDDGLRAGWSVLLYILFVALVGAISVSLLHHFHHPSGPPPDKNASQGSIKPRSFAINEIMALIIFVLPAFIMSLIERRPFGRYGLPAKRMVPDFLTGIFWGFTTLSLLVGTLYLLHAIAFDGIQLHGAIALSYAAKWAFVFLLVGLSEEFFFRGYLLSTVSRGIAGIARTMDPVNPHSHAIGFWISAALFSCGLFAGAHVGNTGENFLGIFSVALVGSVLAFSLWRTGSLWWAVGYHAAWDWAQSYFYGTADSGNVSLGRLIGSHPLGTKLLSGGSDGPEGSVLIIPVLLLTLLIVHLTLPRRVYPITPDQSSPILPAPTESIPTS